MVFCFKCVIVLLFNLLELFFIDLWNQVHADCNSFSKIDIYYVQISLCNFFWQIGAHLLVIVSCYSFVMVLQKSNKQ